MKVGEKNRVEVFDKRSDGAYREITGEIIKVEEGKTLNTEWTEILLNTGYKIVFK